MIQRGKGGIILDLLSYGELDVAIQVKKSEPGDIARIQERAWELATSVSERNDGAGVFFAKAFALAAVEVVEGRGRPLKRQRRDSRSVTRLGWQILSSWERVSVLVGTSLLLAVIAVLFWWVLEAIKTAAFA
jgi:hypothetical protein